MPESPSDLASRIADDLAHDERADFEVLADAARALSRLARGVEGNEFDATAELVLREACLRRTKRTAMGSADVPTVLASLEDGHVLLRAYASVVGSGSGLAARLLRPHLFLVIARHVARQAVGVRPAFLPKAARVESLENALVKAWLATRRRNPHEWLYHPRKTNLSDFVRRKFLADVLDVSERLREMALAGTVACDINVELETDGRKKKLDVVLGQPIVPLGVAEDPGAPLRKARISKPWLTLEIKASMTAHRQATSRLIDELSASLDIVKRISSKAIPVALVVVNVAETFTNPLSLPGPNQNSLRDIERLLRRLVERLPLDKGSGRDKAYGAVGISLVDTDNERLIQAPEPGGRIPPSHAYAAAVARATELWLSCS